MKKLTIVHKCGHTADHEIGKNSRVSERDARDTVKYLRDLHCPMCSQVRNRLKVYKWNWKDFNLGILSGLSSEYFTVSAYTAKEAWSSLFREDLSLMILTFAKREQTEKGHLSGVYIRVQNINDPGDFYDKFHYWTD